MACRISPGGRCIFSDDVSNQDVVGQDGFVVADLAQQFGVVRNQFFNFQSHQLDQTQSPDRFGLQTRQGQPEASRLACSKSAGMMFSWRCPAMASVAA